ncbi:MAG: hypothetical protein V1824_02640 [archaeon]
MVTKKEALEKEINNFIDNIKTGAFDHLNEESLENLIRSYFTKCSQIGNIQKMTKIRAEFKIRGLLPKIFLIAPDKLHTKSGVNLIGNKIINNDRPASRKRDYRKILRKLV